MDGPLLSIYNAPRSGKSDAFGFGDLDLQMKYRILPDKDNLRWPACTLAIYVELPTGNPRNQLGSGIADYWLNGIVQKTLSPRLTYRRNSGILFSGNTLTGAIGVRSTRGLGLRPLGRVPFVTELEAGSSAIEVPVDLFARPIHPTIPESRFAAQSS